jgi:CRISPR/Cas system-associated exonuclease Cas4 (RecB family)
METFLKKVAELINQHPNAENDLCVVFPNRRAGLFLKKLLIPVDGKPRWLPDMLSIEDFVFNISGMQEPDHVTLLAALYRVYCKNVSSPHSFDSFLGWGGEIIRDFEEVDQYLIDPDKLFHFIRDAKEIDIWKPGEDATEFELNYLSFYESLATQYSDLKNDLISQNLAYQGLATSIVAGNPTKFLSNLPWKKILFVGFNALTPAQLKIIKYLVADKTAELIFDADRWYMDNPNMEAGHFLRKYVEDKELGEFKSISNDFLRSNRKIYTCGIPGNTGQARIAGSILNRIPPEEYSQTALVLADESLLLPVLNSLPASIDKFNVTMGFPLIQTPLYSLAEAILIMHSNAINTYSEVSSFYHKDVISILKNEYLKLIVDETLCNNISGKIKSDNYSYIQLAEIIKIADEFQTGSKDLLELIFHKPGNSVQLLLMIEKVLLHLNKKWSAMNDEDQPSGYNLEILTSLLKVVNELRMCLVGEGLQIESFITLQKFFRETAQATKVPFYGEPLHGIQIMGMLETRVLDFKNIVLISVNENLLPAAKSNKSFIPFDIKRKFGMPTHLEKHAVFGYHFYRLLQRCYNAWLIYNENEDTFGGGEKSRYIQQLEWELPLNGIEIIRSKLAEPLPVSHDGEISIKKDPHVLEKLYRKAQKGFSFSSLNTYINCPLSFYFTYIIGIEEPDEVEEDISNRTMGTILHEVLEDVFREFIGRYPDETTLKDARNRADKLVVDKTRSVFPALRIDSGRNLLFIKVAGIWLKRFLDEEIKKIKAGNAPMIIAVEESVTRTIRISIPDQQAGEKEIDLTLYGKIDRIDTIGNEWRVIDYKTGKVESSNVKCFNAEDLFNPDKETSKQLQLLLYKFMSETDTRTTGYNIVPGLISFKMLSNGFMSLETNIASEEFGDHLSDMFREMFNPEIDFRQNSLKNCVFCNFKQICNRNQ